MSNKPFYAVLFALMIGLSACSPRNDSSGDPRKVLTDYISNSFAVKSVDDRKTLTTFLTGDAKSRLIAWSDEQFRETFIDKKREFIRLLIREQKNASPTETNISYELSYFDQQAGGKKIKVTNLKIANLRMNQDKWMIQDVKNVRELVEYQNEMSLP